MRGAVQTDKRLKMRFTVRFIFLAFAWAAMCAGAQVVLAAASADELYREGKYEEAEKRYAEGDMDHPKDTRYRYNRGCAAYQKGDFQSATAAFASVMKRTEEKETLFRAAFNLGNAAFKQGDFASAASHYKQALLVHPGAEDARYNLELALREIEKGEKQKKEEDQQPPSNEEGQKGDGSKAGQQEKQQEKPGDQGEKSEAEKKEPSREDQGQPADKEEAKQDRAEPQGEPTPQQEDAPKDLSGELAPMQEMDKDSGQNEAPPPEASTAMIDRKKAEALLDNVQEDRSRFLQYQLSKEKRRGPQSGKDW